MGSDGEIVVDQPYQHTCMEQLITNFGIWNKTTIQLGWTGREVGVDNVRLDIEDIVEECHDVQKIALTFSHKYNSIAKGQRVIKKDYEVMVQILEKAINKVLLVPACFFPVIVPYSSNLVQKGDIHCFVLLQLANKEGSMGKGLEIVKGRPIPYPGKWVGGRVTITSMDVDGILIFLAIYLRSLEAVNRPKVPICTSSHFLVAIVGFRNKRHVQRGVDNQAMAFASNSLGIKAAQDSLYV